MRVPWTARRSNQSILKEISPEYSLEGLMLKLKLQYFGHLMQRTDSLGKTNHQCNGHEFEEAPGVGDRQGSLVCCSPWGCKESDTTERLNRLQLQCEGLHCSDFSCHRAQARGRPGFSSCECMGLAAPWHMGIFQDQGLNPFPLHWQADC